MREASEDLHTEVVSCALNCQDCCLDLKLHRVSLQLAGQLHWSCLSLHTHTRASMHVQALGIMSPQD